MTDESGEWLDADANGANAEPAALAEILESIAHVLREAPDGKRYDFDVEVTERD